MAVPGRKPYPAELHVLRGGADTAKVTTPDYPVLSERPPDDLTRMGKALWRRIVKNLGPHKIVRATDREMLIILCDQWSTYHEAKRLVQEHGVLIKSRNHNVDRSSVIVNPAWRVMRDAAREIKNLSVLFGLSPSDRARLGMGEVDKKHDSGDLLT